MNTNEKWKYGMLGGTVLVGLIVIIYLIFRMGGAGILDSSHTVYTKFSHVKGLHEGSEVSLAGLRIGVVREITISNDGSKNLIVALSIAKPHMEKIRKDSRAKIMTQGVLGDKYIEIEIGSLDKDPVSPEEFLSSAEDNDIFFKGGKLFDGLSKQIEKGGNIDNILNNIDTITENLVHLTSFHPQKSSVYQEVLQGDSGKKLQQSLSHLNSILAKVDEGNGTLGALVNDPSVYEDLKQVLGNAKRSSVLRYFMDSFKDSDKK